MKLSDFNKDAIVLLRSDGDYVFRDFIYLELSSKNVAEIKSWRESFTRVLNNDTNVGFFFKFASKTAIWVMIAVFFYSKNIIGNRGIGPSTKK